jgi:hypothetical protein
MGCARARKQHFAKYESRHERLCLLFSSSSSIVLRNLRNIRNVCLRL